MKKLANFDPWNQVNVLFFYLVWFYITNNTKQKIAKIKLNPYLFYNLIYKFFPDNSNQTFRNSMVKYL